MIVAAAAVTQSRPDFSTGRCPTALT